MGGLKRAAKAGAKEKAVRGNPNTAHDLGSASIIVALVSCAREICKVKNYGPQPWLVRMPEEFLAMWAVNWQHLSPMNQSLSNKRNDEIMETTLGLALLAQLELHKNND